MASPTHIRRRLGVSRGRSRAVHAMIGMRRVRSSALKRRMASFLKTRPSRLSCGLRPDPLLAGHGLMAWDPCWDTAFRGSHAPGVGAGEPRTSATARGLEGTSAAATAEGYGPDLLGHAVEALEELAEVFAFGAAGDRGAVASSGLQTVLGMEESTPTRSAHDQYGAPRSGSADEPRQSALGRTQNPRRTVEAGIDGLGGDGFELRPPASKATVAGVARVFEEPRQGSVALDFFTVPTATFRVLFVLVVLSHGRRRLVHFNVTEHPTAECGATTHRGVRTGGERAASNPGPGPGLWRTIFASGESVGNPRGGHCGPARRGKTPMRSG
jgi:hypothetical protein